MAERLIIIGASTPTIIRVIDDICDAGERRLHIEGFLDNAHAELADRFHGFDILGGFDAIADYPRDAVLLINTIASSTAARVETTEYFLARGYRFTNIVHPGVNVKYVTMGIGNLVYENALIHPFVHIGNQCVISSNAGIAHETRLQDYAFVGPGSYICGKVEVGKRVFVGAGATILPRLSIGNDAEIGAMTLVNRSVGPGERVIGIPGRGH